jgi:cell wall-associated NlpC family hydrolase
VGHTGTAETKHTRARGTLAALALGVGACLSAPAVALAGLPTLASPPAAAPSPRATATTLAASPDRTVTGRPVTYTATVTPVPDGGAVAFVDAGAPVAGCGAVPVDPATGQASCRTSYPAPGDPSIQADYSGDAGFAASQSAPVQLAVAASLRPARRQRRILGGAIVVLSCARASGGCRGTGTLSTAGGRRLGSDRVAIPAGRTRQLKVGLDRAGKRMLLRAGRLRVILTIASTVDGTRSVVESERLLLRAPSAAQQVSGAEIVAYAKRFIGTPYVYGGNGPGVFDCSGFTSYVFAHFGYHLERSSYAQMQQGRPVRGRLKLGDLVFWDGGGHVGIYTGRDSFISATVHRGIWIYTFKVWEETQAYATARQIIDSPSGSLASIAVAGLPRNGGPADASP